MKKFLPILFLLLAAWSINAQNKAGAVHIISQTKYETVIQFDLEAVQFEAVQTSSGSQYRIHFPGATPILKKGTPDLPKFAINLAIPETGSMQFEVLDSKFHEVPSVDIAPSKGNFKRNILPENVPFTYGEAYTMNSFFPAEQVALQSPAILRNQRGQALWLYPVQYNPMSKTLRVYQSLTIKVYHTNKAGENELLPSQKTTPSRAFQQMYERAFLNYDPALFANESRNGTLDGERLLVVCPEKYATAIQPLVDWKRQMGIFTTVALTEDIGKSGASIQAKIQEMYGNEGLTYALMVGDETDISPIMRPSGGEMYACESCYGYISGNDHLPEVMVGRFIASSAEEVTVMVNRNLEYEMNPARDTAMNWFENGLAAASNEGAGIGDDGQADWQHGNEWKTKHLADGYKKYWEFYDADHSTDSPTPGDATADKAGNPVNTDIIAVMNQKGITLYNYTGHGWEQGLVSGNFSVQAVNSSLRNDHHYPMIIGVACCAGDYTDNTGGDCLGEAVQRAANPTTGAIYGAIAGYFSSDYQSWVPPMEGQDQMNQFLVDADGVTLAPTLGSMLLAGNTGMVTAYAADGEAMADFWIPFAEPSTVPRTRFPLNMVAEVPSNVYLGESQLTVTSSIEGALVGVYFQGQTIGSGIIENGSATITFSSLNNVGALIITVSQFNYVPFQQTLQVSPKSGPFVISQAIEMDDAMGDNDKIADYGETILLNVNLANVGLDSAQNIEVELRSTDSVLSLIDNQESWGTLDTSANLYKAGAFSFKVADNAQDKYKADLVLHITYNDTLTYEVIYSLKIQAPKFSIANLVIDDSAGNGNGRMDAGETVTVRVQTKNIGHSDSPIALGTLNSTSPYLTISAADDLGVLAVDDTVWASFDVSVSNDAPISILSVFDYEVSGGAYAASASFNRLINSIIEDFESVNFNSFPWKFVPGNTPWSITAVGAYEGTHCARSGTISSNRKTQMQLTLDFLTDGTVAFARKVSSEEDYDFLKFYIDSIQQEEWSGEQEWLEVSFPINAGVHTLLWSYEKDDLAQGGQDRAWVDAINLPPYQVVSGLQTLEVDGLSAKISPNPLQSIAYLDMNLEESKDLSIQVVNAFGQKLKEISSLRYPAGDQRLMMDFSGIPSGFYFVLIRENERVQVLRFMKE